jgi:hypothetical protein
MRRDVDPIHRSREDTREPGYLDTDYWGFRFPHRRSSPPRRELHDGVGPTLAGIALADIALHTRQPCSELDTPQTGFWRS